MYNDIWNIISSLNNGKLVIFPTETVYAIAVDAMNEIAIESLYKIKNRDISKKFTVMVPNISWVKEISTLTEFQLNFIEYFIPAAITFVVYANFFFKENKFLNCEKIGIRVPNHNIAMKILANFNSPIVATSVNLSGQNSGASFKDIRTIKCDGIYMLNNIDSYYEDDTYVKSVHSTVVDITEDTPKILRNGVISYDEILYVWGVINQKCF